MEKRNCGWKCKCLFFYFKKNLFSENLNSSAFFCPIILLCYLFTKQKDEWS